MNNLKDEDYLLITSTLSTFAAPSHTISLLLLSPELPRQLKVNDQDGLNNNSVNKKERNLFNLRYFVSSYFYLIVCTLILLF